MNKLLVVFLGVVISLPQLAEATIPNSAQGRRVVTGLVREAGIPDARINAVVSQIIAESKARKFTLKTSAKIIERAREIVPVSERVVPAAAAPEAFATASQRRVAEESRRVAEAEVRAFTRAQYNAVLAEVVENVAQAETLLKEVTDAVARAKGAGPLAAKREVLDPELGKKVVIEARINAAVAKRNEIDAAIREGKPLEARTLTDADTEIAKTTNMKRDFNTAIYDMVTDYIFTKAKTDSFVSLADANTIDDGVDLNTDGRTFKYLATFVRPQNPNAILRIEKSSDPATLDIGSNVMLMPLNRIIGDATNLGDEDAKYLKLILKQLKFVLGDVVDDADGNKTIDYAADNSKVRLVDIRIP